MKHVIVIICTATALTVISHAQHIPEHNQAECISI